MAAGDSITQGVANSAQGDNNPQYRTSIAALLAANGYKPKFRGIWRYSDRNGANVRVPDDWAYHCGFGCAAIRTTESSGGLADNMPFYLDIAGYPDVITLLIGTNDLGMNGKEAADVFETYVQLVNDTAAQRPDAKIIGATLLPRPGEAGEKVVAFNALLSAEYAKSGKGDLPDNFFLIDLHPLVPNDAVANNATGNYAEDNVHPNWKGHAIIAEAFYGKIAELLPLATFAGAGDATVTDAEQTALGAANIADLAAYRSGMTHVYTIEKDGAAGATNCFTSVPYTSTENQSASSRTVSKVGYFMELVRKGTNRRRWVWVDMEATGKTLGEVEFPWNNDNMQRIATKLHVKSNYAGIHDVAAKGVDSALVMRVDTIGEEDDCQSLLGIHHDERARVACMVHRFGADSRFAFVEEILPYSPSGRTLKGLVTFGHAEHRLQRFFPERTFLFGFAVERSKHPQG
jgi:lysophospholipase L1-like esterase